MVTGARQNRRKEQKHGRSSLQAQNHSRDNIRPLRRGSIPPQCFAAGGEPLLRHAVETKTRRQQIETRPFFAPTQICSKVVPHSHQIIATSSCLHRSCGRSHSTPVPAELIGSTPWPFIECPAASTMRQITSCIETPTNKCFDDNALINFTGDQHDRNVGCGVLPLDTRHLFPDAFSAASIPTQSHAEKIFASWRPRLQVGSMKQIDCLGAQRHDPIRPLSGDMCTMSNMRRRLVRSRRQSNAAGCRHVSTTKMPTKASLRPSHLPSPVPKTQDRSEAARSLHQD